MKQLTLYLWLPPVPPVASITNCSSSYDLDLFPLLGIACTSVVSQVRMWSGGRHSLENLCRCCPRYGCGCPNSETLLLFRDGEML